jgi:hypothetical protein
MEMKFYKGVFLHKVESAETVGILDQFYYWYIPGPQENGMREGGTVKHVQPMRAETDKERLMHQPSRPKIGHSALPVVHYRCGSWLQRTAHLRVVSTLAMALAHGHEGRGRVAKTGGEW